MLISNVVKSTIRRIGNVSSKRFRGRLPGDDRCHLGVKHTDGRCVRSYMDGVFVLLCVVDSRCRDTLCSWKGRKNGIDGLRRLLISLCGLCFACWVFDVVTTHYALNVIGGFEESNPLGFPFGVFGALIFYVPASVFIYVLLFQLRHRLSLSVAFLLTFIALYMGFMNLGAGLQSLGFSSDPFPVLLEMTFALLAVLTRSGLAFQTRKRSTLSSKAA